MSMEEVEIVRGRTTTFLKYAKEPLKREDFNFVCFSKQEVAQLFIKSVIPKLVNEIPSLHRVRKLLYLLSKSDAKELVSAEQFIQEIIKGDAGAGQSSTRFKGPESPLLAISIMVAGVVLLVMKSYRTCIVQQICLLMVMLKTHCLRA